MTAFSPPAGDGKKRRDRRERPARKPRKSAPLDATSLRDLALSYAARFATTGAKVEAYLARKIRERGLAEDGDGRTVEVDVRALVERLVELGYVDDDAYARMKSRDLTERGYGARRVEQALWAAGVDEQVREEHAPSELAAREAAVLLARKRRFGPFGDRTAKGADRDSVRKLREKQVAAMLRAGHQYEHVRFILDASGDAMIAEWLDEARGDEGDDGFESN